MDTAGEVTEFVAVGFDANALFRVRVRVGVIDSMVPHGESKSESGAGVTPPHTHTHRFPDPDLNRRANASGFYSNMLSVRRFWDQTLEAEGMMQLTLPDTPVGCLIGWSVG